MDRRRFLVILAAGLASASAARGSDGPGALAAPRPPARAPVAAQAAARPVGEAVDALPVPSGPEVVTELAGGRRSLALTIDDGTNTEVVAAFTALAARTGVRLTFFPNGRYASWRDNAPALRPLIDSGQIAMGNHTWSHPDLTTLPDAEVAAEITRNRDFLRQSFGVRDSPFFRPPYGAHDERTDRIAADVGHPVIAMWNGTLGDSTVLSGAELMASARRWFSARAIIVGHANHPPVTTVLDELLGLLEERRLTTVTLDDVWASKA